jgi:hypothetical protein
MKLKFKNHHRNISGLIFLLILLVALLLTNSQARLSQDRRVSAQTVATPTPDNLRYACATDSDCGCGRDMDSGTCAVENIAFLNGGCMQPDFCTGPNGDQVPVCMNNTCQLSQPGFTNCSAHDPQTGSDPWTISSVEPYFLNDRVGFVFNGHFPNIANCGATGSTKLVQIHEPVEVDYLYGRGVNDEIYSMDTSKIVVLPKYVMSDGLKAFDVILCQGTAMDGQCTTGVRSVSGSVAVEKPPYQIGDLNSDRCVNTQDYTVWLGNKDAGCAAP